MSHDFRPSSYALLTALRDSVSPALPPWCVYAGFDGFVGDAESLWFEATVCIRLLRICEKMGLAEAWLNEIYILMLGVSGS